LSWYSQPGSSSPVKVGGAPNYYGISNMHGLIWEWVDDFNALLVSADSRNQGDPDQLQYCGAGAISLQDRDNFAILMRVALLSAMNGANTTRQLGFRCAKTYLRKNHETTELIDYRSAVLGKLSFAGISHIRAGANR
jgi:formylglycine-generating enzyme required for sulfatase activity